MMTASKNEKVKGFLSDLSITDPEKFETLSEMRETVFAIYPNTDEQMMYGGIMFVLQEEHYSGLFVRKNHISFEFGNGFSMDDPDKILEGSGKFRRHLKIRSKDEVIDKRVEFFVKQSID